MGFDEEARRLIERMEIDPYTNRRAWDAMTRDNVGMLAAALRAAFMLGTRHRVDAAFSQLIANLVPYMDAQSMHAVHAECAKIEERLAPPAPKPDAGEAADWCAPCALGRRCGGGDGYRCPRHSPNPVSQPTAQPNGEGVALGRRPHETFWANVDAAAAEVATWPAWRRGVREEPAAQPEPVTYRAGTVPPRIEVGMILVDPEDDRPLRVAAMDGEGEVLMQPRSGGRAVWCMEHDVEDWPLARDFTEPRGGECDNKMHRYARDGWRCPDCDKVVEDCDGTGRAK
jgi:hypothetical protein